MSELLAPAGGMEALIAAVQNGADAVYLGARLFNARRGADNFDEGGLKEAVSYCHARGVRVHVTLNTLVRNGEMAALEEQVREVAEAGADAVIVQDLGVAALVRKMAPGLSLHASTQMAVHNRQCDTGVAEGQTAVVVPKKSLIEIARLLTEEEEETVLLQIDRNYISAQLGSVRVYARLIDGEFINYQRILPTGWKTRVKVNCAQFSSCVERASLVARESKNNLMRIDVDGDRMVVTSNSDIGESYEEIEVETDGEPMKITFNVRYLSDAFRVIKDEYVYLQMTSPVSPMTIVPFGGDAFLYLILPVRAAA